MALISCWDECTDDVDLWVAYQREMGVFGTCFQLEALQGGESGFKGPCSDHFGLEILNCVCKIGNCGILSCKHFIQLHNQLMLRKVDCECS